jgi:hypothetical protein
VSGVAKSIKLARSEFSVLIALAIAFTGCGGGGSNSAPPQPQTTSLGSLVDSLANSAMKQQGIPGMTVALAKNGSMGTTERSRSTRRMERFFGWF